ncbi:hypothetical protein MUCCIDRAFT_104585 [Mucor lusitanicus CBS 277.49]|uniref:Uncharacterized protein n=1 Tax=Mucor lusitanicus CBS 277.49 TaxID=747725 RepID=A0A168PF54_MUCCL|nr:hypothetical protein MUCCIDRAFT_104585 [Mucor lusitanicus CBS 277.49]
MLQVTMVKNQQAKEQRIKMYLVKMLLMKKLASTMKTRKIEEEVFSGDDDTDYHHTSDDEDIEVQEDEATDTASKNYLPNTFVQQRHPFSTFFYYFIVATLVVHQLSEESENQIAKDRT